MRGDAPFVEWLRQNNPVRPILGSAADRIVRGERIVHVIDRRKEDAYRSNEVFRRLALTLEKRILEALATPGRLGVRKIAARFGVNPGTVQRINRPLVAPSVVALIP